MDVDALRGRANELGVEWSYWDNEGRYHESDMEAVRRVVEVLEADAVTGPRNLAPVIVGSPASIPVGEGVDQVRLALADGTELELEVSDGAVSFSDVLPIGNHRLSLTGPGLDESTTIVVAPDRMPSSVALAGRTGVFAPAYALWEHDSPLPSFEQLRGLSEALPGLGVDLLVTLPLYAGVPRRAVRPEPVRPGEPPALERGVPQRHRAARGRRAADDRPGRLAGARPASPASTARRRRGAGGRERPRAVGADRSLGGRAPRRRRLRPLPGHGRRRPDRPDAAPPGRRGAATASPSSSPTPS